MQQSITNTAQKMKFFNKDFFSKRHQIRRKLRIWSHLLKKSLIENFIFCAMKKVVRYIIQILSREFFLHQAAVS